MISVYDAGNVLSMQHMDVIDGMDDMNGNYLVKEVRRL